MKLFLPLLFALFFAGCGIETDDTQPPCCPNGQCPQPVPVLDPYRTVAPAELPQAWRHGNYAGGSCLWASVEDVLAWQGQHEQASWVRHNCQGAAGVHTDIVPTFESLGLRFAYVDNGDEHFLEWCSRTRRAAAIYWEGGVHAITFCGYVGSDAKIIDNNYRDRVQTLTRQKFLAAWHNAGGVAFTVVYMPPPSRPFAQHFHFFDKGVSLCSVFSVSP